TETGRHVPSGPTTQRFRSHPRRIIAGAALSNAPTEALGLSNGLTLPALPLMIRRVNSPPGRRSRGGIEMFEVSGGASPPLVVCGLGGSAGAAPGRPHASSPCAI